MQLAAAYVAGFDPKPEGVPTSITWACNYKRTARILLVHNLHSPLWTQDVWELKPSVTNGAAVAPVPSTLAATLPALHCFRRHLPAPNQAVPKLVTHWKWGCTPYLRAAVHLTISQWKINLNRSHRCPSSSFSYTSHAGFIFIWGVSLTYPVLASYLCREFLLHIPCWLLKRSLLPPPPPPPPPLPFDFSVAFQTVLGLVFDVSEEQKLCQEFLLLLLLLLLLSLLLSFY